MKHKTVQFEAIGTHWSLSVLDNIEDDAWQATQDSLQLRIKQFDRHYSRFRDDSLVTAMAKNAGNYELPADGYRLLSFYERLYKATDGKVTPLIGQTLADAGYDAHYSLHAKKITQPPAWEDVISYTKTDITLAQPALLDFGAAGKGYLVDIIGELLAQAGFTNYTVNAGGDILHRSKSGEKLEIGMENPFDTTEAIGITTLTNQSLCASAGSKRAWGDFTHILDPQSLQSPTKVAATWVIANNTMTADGLATALFFTDPARLAKDFDFSYALLGKNSQLTYAKDFPVTLFTADNYASH